MGMVNIVQKFGKYYKNDKIFTMSDCNLITDEIYSFNYNTPAAILQELIARRRT